MFHEAGKRGEKAAERVRRAYGEGRISYEEPPGCLARSLMAHKALIPDR